LFNTPGVIVDGNYLLTPSNRGNRGQNVVFFGGSDATNGGTVTNNYTHYPGYTDAKYKYLGGQEDSLSVQFGSTNITISGNYVEGGKSKSGCSIIIDGGAYSTGNATANFSNNRLYNGGQAGICVEGGNDVTVAGNRIHGDNTNGHPLQGGGNTAI